MAEEKHEEFRAQERLNQPELEEPDRKHKKECGHSLGAQTGS